MIDEKNCHFNDPALFNSYDILRRLNKAWREQNKIDDINYVSIAEVKKLYEMVIDLLRSDQR